MARLRQTPQSVPPEAPMVDDAPRPAGVVYSGPPLEPLPAGAHLLQLLLEWSDREPGRPIAGFRDGTEVRWVSAGDFAARVRSLAKGLVAAGVNAGDRVALLSRTRVEWPLTDFAILMAGAVTVPIYETSSVEQLRWILTDSGARVAVVETAVHQQRCEEALPASLGCPRRILIDDGGLETLARSGRDIPDAVLDERLAGLGRDSLATILYTSGTTGRPKGCMLSHGNLLGNVEQIFAMGSHMFGPGETSLLFLPMAHALARMIWLFGLKQGMATVFAGDVLRLPEALLAVRPTVMVAVPRVFEKAFSGARHKAAAGGHARLFDRAADAAVAWSETGSGGGRPPLRQTASHTLYDRLLYRRIRAAFGGRLRIAVSGGGPLGDWLTHFFTGVGVEVYEGYGLTEASPVLSLNVAGAWHPGTVGRPVPATELCVAEDGEILARGRQIFGGYWQNEAGTAEVLAAGGWLCTGDIGAFDTDGYLRITGRKKDIIVTSAGKNVAPAPLEERLRAHPLVSQAVLVGDRRPYVAALIALDAEGLRDWCEERGRPVPDHGAAMEDPEVRAALQEAVDAANASVSQAESIRRFALLPRDLTVEADELTPTLKVRRGVVEEEYASVIDGLYTRPTGPAVTR
jgi:long-chain acyl-CoA synthetase